MVRIATHEACVVLIDRVSPEDHEQRTYQNRLGKLRTPSKTYVYSESQLVAALVGIGLIVEAQARYAEAMEVDTWLRAAGVDEPTAHTNAATSPTGPWAVARRSGKRAKHMKLATTNGVRPCRSATFATGRYTRMEVAIRSATRVPNVAADNSKTLVP
jgi:hypothetical protein